VRSDQPPADADLDALTKHVDRWSATHSERSNQTRDLLYRLLDALRAARTAQAQAEQSRDQEQKWREDLGDAVVSEREQALEIIATLGIPDTEDQGGHPVPGATRDTLYALRWLAKERADLAAKLAAAEQQLGDARASLEMYRVAERAREIAALRATTEDR